MNFGPILDTVNLRQGRLLEANIIKLHKTQSDMMFLTYCKKCDIIPKGLRLRNPIKSQTIALFNKGRHICDQAGRLAINAAINNTYRKQRLLQQNLQQRSPHTYKETARQLDIYCNIQKKKIVEHKVNKLYNLCKNNPILERSASFLLKSSLVFHTKETTKRIPPKTPTWLTYPTLNYHLSTTISFLTHHITLSPTFLSNNKEQLENYPTTLTL